MTADLGLEQLGYVLDDEQLFILCQPKIKTGSFTVNSEHIMSYARPACNVALLVSCF